MFGQQAAPPAKPAPPPAADRNAFTFLDYRLDLQLDTTQQRLGARGEITLRNDSSVSQSLLAMQISSSLKWASIRISGSPVAFAASKIDSGIDHTSAVNEAVVALSQPVAPGAALTLEVAYQGLVPADATRLENLGMPSVVARHSDFDRISPDFTVLRGVGYVLWYPVAIEPALVGEGNQVFERLGEWKVRHQRSSMRLKISALGAPEEVFHLIGGGSIMNGTAAESGGGRIFTAETSIEQFGMDVPVIAFLPGRVAQSDLGAVLYSRMTDDEANGYLKAAAAVVPPVANGAKKRFTLVELPADYPAFESGTLLLTPLRPGAGAPMQAQLVHLMAHTAFDSPRVWMKEGLAHYSQLAWKSANEGNKAVLDALIDRRPSLAIAEMSADGSAARSLIHSGDEVFYRVKAMYVWWMLRGMVGEDVLQRAIAAYHPSEEKEASYFQRLLEKESKRDLGWFFDDWVYRDRGLPDLHIVSVYPRAVLEGGYVVTVTVENLGDAGAEVPVRVRWKESEAMERLVVKGKDKATIRITVPLPPVEVIVNDGSVPENDPTNNNFTVPAAAPPR